VPPLATSKRPIRWATAPVKEPFSVPEQFALEQILGDGRAIHFHQRTLGARAPRMNHIGQNLLAHAALAGDQDAAFRRGNERRVVKDGLQSAGF